MLVSTRDKSEVVIMKYSVDGAMLYRGLSRLPVELFGACDYGYRDSVNSQLIIVVKSGTARHRARRRRHRAYHVVAVLSRRTRWLKWSEIVPYAPLTPVADADCCQAVRSPGGRGLCLSIPPPSSTNAFEAHTRFYYDKLTNTAGHLSVLCFL